MNLTVSFKNIESTQAVKDYVEKKLEKLQKFYPKPLTIHVVLIVEKLNHIADVTVTSKGLTLKFIESSKDLYASIDLVHDKIERHLVKSNQKYRKHKISISEVQVLKSSIPSSSA